MTAQVHERLILEGEETSMAFCPPLPSGHPRIVPVSRDEAAKYGGIITSTACWRRYIGTWELREGCFYLVHIEGVVRLDGDEPLFADWFSGVLRIPSGERLHYVHMGFGSVYEFETHIKIEKGYVTDERRIDNRNKDVNTGDLGFNNLPGRENQFDGDDL
jgi:hypothetical protein